MSYSRYACCCWAALYVSRSETHATLCGYSSDNILGFWKRHAVEPPAKEFRRRASVKRGLAATEHQPEDTQRAASQPLHGERQAGAGRADAVADRRGAGGVRQPRKCEAAYIKKNARLSYAQR